MTNYVTGIGWDFNYQQNLTALTLNQTKNKCLILMYSVYDTEEELSKLNTFIEDADFAAVLKLNLEDLDNEIIVDPKHHQKIIGPNLQNTRIITQFIKNHQHQDFIVACHQGISRTGAVIEYLRQQFKYELATASNQNFIANRLMLKYFAENDDTFSGQALYEKDYKLIDGIIF